MEVTCIGSHGPWAVLAQDPNSAHLLSTMLLGVGRDSENHGPKGRSLGMSETW